MGTGEAWGLWVTAGLCVLVSAPRLGMVGRFGRGLAGVALLVVLERPNGLGVDFRPPE